MKYLMPIVILVIVIFSPLKTHAATKEKTFDINFNCSVAKNLIVRPIVDTGLIYIFNQKWLSGNLLWSQLSVLQPKMQIRVLNWLGNKINLSFALQDPQTSKIYETPKYEVVMAEYDQTYIKRLNENLAQIKEEVKDSVKIL